jgi:VIT1/CCC1 family predicted Fe2+/Mn2+ transporter
MEISIKKGLSFGLTSGVITTLGLIVGLHSSTHSKIAVVSAILIIAIADALSDAMGIHISEESESKHSSKEIWIATFSTFLAKFIFALTFMIPVLLFSLTLAIIISIGWGTILIAVFSFYIAREQGVRPYKVILEHVLMMVIVIVLTHYIGDFLASFH